MSDRSKRGRFEVYIHGPHSEDVIKRLTDTVTGMEPQMYYTSMLTTFYTDEVKKSDAVKK